MLDFFRRGVKSWVAKILLAVLILSFAVWGIGDIFLGGQTRNVAMVGDTEVPSERFFREIYRQQSALSRQRGEIVSGSELRDAGIDDRVIAGLARDATFAQELSDLGIAVSDRAVSNNIRSNVDFQNSDGSFSQFIYDSILTQRGFDAREYEGLTRELLGQQILLDAVAVNIPATPGVAEQLAAYQGEQRRVSTIRLEADDAADPGQPDDAALTAFFEANSDDFIEPERRWGRYLHTDIARLATELAPTAEEVRAEYDENPDTYTVRASRTLEQIGFDDQASAEDAVERLRNGTATWEEIAAERNVALEDLPLGTVTEGSGELPDATEQAVFALSEPGFAGPIEGLFGFLLLNVTEVELGGLTPFEEIEERIADSMARFRAQEEAVTRANKIDDVRAGGATLEEVAQQTGLELRSFAGMDPSGLVKEGEQPMIAADPRFMSELRDAIDGEELDITQLSDGSYVLIMVDRIEESHLPDLATIRERVIEAWRHEQRLAAQEARAAELLSAGNSLETISATVLSGITPHEAFTRDRAPGVFSPALVEAVFSAAEGDTVIGRSRDGQAVFLTAVNGVTPLADDVMTEQVTVFADILSDSLSRDQLEYFSRALEARHDATINTTAINEVFDQLDQARGGY